MIKYFRNISGRKNFHLKIEIHDYLTIKYILIHNLKKYEFEFKITFLPSTKRCSPGNHSLSVTIKILNGQEELR